jgi:hypothetical protein
MERNLLPALAATIALTGCAGLDLRSMTREQAASVHTKDNTISGYVLYAPMVVVDVTLREVCVGKDAAGKCINEPRCSAGSPFVLPDYSKPYRIDVRSGLGKAGVDVSIAEGWRLGGIKDSSDNTAVLGLVEKFLAGAGVLTAKVTNGAPGRECKAAGLYRVSIDDTGPTLTKLFSYQ